MSQVSLFSTPAGMQIGCRHAQGASMAVGQGILTCPGWSEGHTQVFVAYTLVRRRTFLSESTAYRSVQVHIGIAADHLPLPRLPGYRTPFHEVPRLLAPCTANCHGCRLQSQTGPYTRRANTDGMGTAWITLILHSEIPASGHCRYATAIHGRSSHLERAC
jgi:hypothetical protein